MQFLAQIEACHRTDLRGIAHRVAEPERFNFGFEFVQEFVGDLRHDDETLGGDARLPAIEEARSHRHVHSEFHIRVVQHDEWVGAT